MKIKVKRPTRTPHDDDRTAVREADGEHAVGQAAVSFREKTEEFLEETLQEKLLLRARRVRRAAAAVFTRACACCCFTVVHAQEKRKTSCVVTS